MLSTINTYPSGHLKEARWKTNLNKCTIFEDVNIGRDVLLLNRDYVSLYSVADYRPGEDTLTEGDWRNPTP